MAVESYTRNVKGPHHTIFFQIQFTSAKVWTQSKVKNEEIQEAIEQVQAVLAVIQGATENLINLSPSTVSSFHNNY